MIASWPACATLTRRTELRPSPSPSALASALVFHLRSSLSLTVGTLAPCLFPQTPNLLVRCPSRLFNLLLTNMFLLADEVGPDYHALEALDLGSGDEYPPEKEDLSDDGEQSFRLRG